MNEITNKNCIKRINQSIKKTSTKIGFIKVPEQPPQKSIFMYHNQQVPLFSKSILVEWSWYVGPQNLSFRQHEYISSLKNRATEREGLCVSGYLFTSSLSLSETLQTNKSPQNLCVQKQQQKSIVTRSEAILSSRPQRHNRGNTPMIWLLSLGRNEQKSTWPLQLSLTGSELTSGSHLALV